MIVLLATLIAPEKRRPRVPQKGLWMNDRNTQRDGLKALNMMRQRILRLEFGPGSVLDEAELAQTMKVSRTPVREAIIQLISEELVIRDGRSARIAPLNLDDIPRLFDALLVASRMIDRLAAENRTPADLKRIEAAHRDFESCMYSGDHLERQEANIAFHMAIAEAAHNPYFFDFYRRTLMASSRFSGATFRQTDKAEVAESISGNRNADLFAHIGITLHQHTLILKAIQERDVEQADRLATEHQEHWYSWLQRQIFSHSSSINLSLR
ncbi:MAG: GntR family transcriptional regulator [Mesorhizobium sp.]|nr:MAG: GntR family transcriptional regulator [Mesorhizobium sp.]